jgi:hypothetical protein
MTENKNEEIKKQTGVHLQAGICVGTTAQRRK